MLRKVKSIFSSVVRLIPNVLSITVNTVREDDELGRYSIEIFEYVYVRIGILHYTIVMV